VFYVSLPGQSTSKVDSLRFLIETSGNDSIRVQALTDLSRHYLFSDIKRATGLAGEALTIAEKSANEQLLQIAIFNLGNVYFESGAFEISVNYFMRYIEVMRKQDNKRGVAAAESNLGAIYLMLEEYEKSIPYFENALAYFESLPVDETKLTPLHELYTLCNNLGVVHQNLNDYEKAVEYYNRGIILAKRHYDGEKAHAILLNNLGSVFIEKEQFDKAYEYLEKSLAIRLANNDLNGTAQSYRMLGRYYLATDDYPQALENLYAGYSLSKQVGNKTLEAEILDFLYQVWQKLKNADSALTYYKLHSELTEELNKDAAAKELMQFEITSQYQEKEKLMQMEQKRREMYYLFIGLILALLLAVVGLLYFLSHNRNRRLKLEKEVTELNAKNLALEKANLQKELNSKNKELTTNVMYQIQNNELIHTIVQKLHQFTTSAKKPGEKEILDIIRDLEKTQDQTLWNEFEIRFQQVHNDFYDRLNEISPDLTVNERRLCAFLRLNMTSKEISSITGQAPRTIDVARTRLRKKLNLTNSETGLVEFLSGV
jgi:tetratricopeptide (TPR) repeat protein